MTYNVSRVFAVMPAIGLGGSILAAVDRNAILAWTGAGVAAAGIVLQQAIHFYHQAREARREENTKDHAAELEVVRLLGTVQRELESRIMKSEHDIIELTRQIDAVRCVFPNPDGSPRCKGAATPS